MIEKISLLHKKTKCYMKRSILFKNFLSLFLLFVTCCSLAYSQEITVTGRVTDKETGLPLEQVSVAVKGTSKGTYTNIKGEFSLQVPTTADFIVFSHVGKLRQEIKVGSQKEFSVSLETDNNTLEDVVLVGYGTQK